MLAARRHQQAFLRPDAQLLVDALAAGPDHVAELLLRERQVDLHAFGRRAPVAAARATPASSPGAPAERAARNPRRAPRAGAVAPRAARPASIATRGCRSRKGRKSRRSSTSSSRRLERDDRRRARIRVEQRDLADHLARIADVEDDLLAVARRLADDLEPTRRARRRAGGPGRPCGTALRRVEATRAGDAHERVERALVERGEDRDVGEQPPPIERTPRLRALPLVSPVTAAPQRGAKAAKSSSNASIWLPCADDGTRIGVVTPAARQASTPRAPRRRCRRA